MESASAVNRYSVKLNIKSDYLIFVILDSLEPVLVDRVSNKADRH